LNNRLRQEAESKA